MSMRHASPQTHQRHNPVSPGSVSVGPGETCTFTPMGNNQLSRELSLGVSVRGCLSSLWPCYELETHPGCTPPSPEDNWGTPPPQELRDRAVWRDTPGEERSKDLCCCRFHTAQWSPSVEEVWQSPDLRTLEEHGLVPEGPGGRWWLTEPHRSSSPVEVLTALLG